jgi:4-amino-4-deoxy-L-arabinose transferase-like glycosyltransferase
VGDARLRSSWVGLAALALAFALAWFATLDYRKLVRADEGRYAEIAREMVASGDWVTPRYNGVKYFDKPPLQYWMTSVAFAVFGENEWTARLWTGLTGFAGVLLVGWTAFRLYGARVGVLAAAILASSPLWVLAGHYNSLDMSVAFFLAAALCFFLLAQREGASSRASHASMLGCWASMGLAVLSKGLIGVVLPGLVLAVYLALVRDWTMISRLRIAEGIVILTAIVSPWFVAVMWRNPEFASFFFVHEHLGRFTSVEGHNRYQPWWYFFVLLALGLLPWTLALPRVAAALWRAPWPAATPSDRAGPVLCCWAVLIFAFFTLSRSKLPGYILPVLPALAILAARELASSARLARTVVFATVVMGLAWVAGSTWIADFADDEDVRSAYARFAAWSATGGALAASGGLAALWMLARSRRIGGDASLPCLLLVAATLHGGVQIAGLGHDALRGRMSAYDLAQRVNEVIDRSEPFYAVRTFDHTLPFYTKKALTLVDHEDELWYGLRNEPGLRIGSIAAFEAAWNAGRCPMALVEPEMFERLRGRGLGMRVVARDAERVIVQKSGPNEARPPCASP